MITHTRSAALEEFLRDSLPRFHEPPDADWVHGVAQMFSTTDTIVWSGVRQRMPAAPVAPRPLTWPRPSHLEVPVAAPVTKRMPESSRPRGFDEVVRRFQQHGHDLRSNRGGFMTRCPLHRDRKPSLQISRGRYGRTALVYCHACKGKTKQILAAVGLTQADLFPDDLTHQARPMREVTDEYPYVSMAAVHVATKVRYRDTFHDKRFAWRVGNRWKLTDAEKDALPLYRERDLIDCATIYVVEGEKAVDRLWEEGLSATCGAHGAGTWELRWSLSLSLLGAEQVVILTDHDAAGRAHGELVAASIAAEQIEVQVVALPDLTAGQDVYDWLANGCTVEVLEAIVAGTPAWTPDLAEQQRIEQRRKKWREKKARQRRERRKARAIAAVPLRKSDTTGVSSRMSGSEPSGNSVPLSPCPPCERISDQPSKVNVSRDLSDPGIEVPHVSKYPGSEEISVPDQSTFGDFSPGRRR